jgi:hypothetical protein
MRIFLPSSNCVGAVGRLQQRYYGCVTVQQSEETVIQFAGQVPLRRAIFHEIFIQYSSQRWQERTD